VVGLPVDALLRAADQGGTKEPAWRKISVIEVRAGATGIVDKLPVATGGWVEPGELVLAITDLSRVRFRARGLQSDLPDLHDGLPAVVVPARGSAASSDRLSGTLLLGVEADPAQRTIDLFVQPSATAAWCRPGVAGFLEVETRGGAEAELAIPLSAVLQDGLQRVFFRRDPADADKVIRVEADLGLDDGRWVEVKSGLVDGDEVVLAGAYELMLASSGTAPKGGHFHADGTFHEGKDK
jgi:multidrug efflux pump subunit AcrA (membrane-fusion protein)